MSEISRYASHTKVTDPGSMRETLECMPKGMGAMPELVEAVQGLLVHVFWAERYGMLLSEEKRSHVQSRLVSRILEIIKNMDSSPLTVKRPFEKRFVGNCRDFSVLLCSILREQGVPARARCGFGSYFRPGGFEDHWVCQYWNGERWVTVDAQLDDFQRKALRIDFDSLDMPSGKFIHASEAWLMCRKGTEDPDKFGIFDMHGLWFVRGNLLRELAALNGAEMLPWDVWGLMEINDEEMTEEDYALLERVASSLTRDSDEIHAIYDKEPRLRAPQEMIVSG